MPVLNIPDMEKQRLCVDKRKKKRKKQKRGNMKYGKAWNDLCFQKWRGPQKAIQFAGWVHVGGCFNFA